MDFTTNPAPNQGALLTEKDVARLLGCSSRHVFTLSSKGELPHIKIGALKRYSRNDVDAFLAANRHGGEA